MATLTTKYSVGDVVWRAGTMQTQKRHPCPDCLGAGSWKATSPAGREYSFSCPRCASSYQSDRDLSLTYTTHVPHVERLTIGSVKVDTNSGPWADREPFSYMCVETGVGSGSVYYESDLFASEEEAKKAAEIKAKAIDAEVPWIGALYNKTLSLSDYQMGDAAMKSAGDMKVRHRVDLQMLFDDLRGCETIEQVTETIEKFEFRP